MAAQKSSIKKPVMSEGDIFVVRRKSRPGIINDSNRHIYSKDAFNAAMSDYVSRGARLYLAPVVVTPSDEMSINIVKKINNDVYHKFHWPNPTMKFMFATIVNWDDYTFTCRYEPTGFTEKYVSSIDENTQALLRYIASNATNTISNAMIITGIDIPIIPFKDLGIDINDYLKDKDVNTINLLEKYGGI